MSEKIQQLQNNAAEDLSDGIWRLSIHGDGIKERVDGETQLSLLYPVRPGEPDCVYYLRNRICGYGTNCRFNHPTFPSEGTDNKVELPRRAEQPDCGYFLKTGRCKYGQTCKFNHPKDNDGAKPVSFNALGLPIREEETPCPYYMRMGQCKYGAFCKFHHPQLENNGAASLGKTESSIFPSSLLSTFYPQNLSQCYISSFISPSQGIKPSQGWDTYVVNSLGTMNNASFIPNLPERLGQPECRYFMNTGNCKYGYECKFHHPKDRNSQLASNLIGPFGLPLRPGQTICLNYNLYGLCKYGPTCKYDHPWQGYSYGYNWNMSNCNQTHWFTSSKDHPLSSITSDHASTTIDSDLPCLSNGNEDTSTTEALKDQSELVETSSHSEQTVSQDH